MDWIQLVTTLLLAMAAAGGVIISVSQLWLKKQEYKYSLFERRVDFYKEVMDTYRKVNQCSHADVKYATDELTILIDKGMYATVLYSRRIEDLFLDIVSFSNNILDHYINSDLNSDKEKAESPTQITQEFYRKQKNELLNKLSNFMQELRTEMNLIKKPAPRWLRWLVG